MRERVYLKVDTFMDEAGLMIPRTIICADGRRFPIDRVSTFHKASLIRKGMNGIYYTIVIGRETRTLFFQKADGQFEHLAGRWFVEREGIG